MPEVKVVMAESQNPSMQLHWIRLPRSRQPQSRGEDIRHVYASGTPALSLTLDISSTSHRMPVTASPHACVVLAGTQHLLVAPDRVIHSLCQV
jgi:hypothetical protein